MEFLRNPNLLFGLRITQLLIALGFIVLIAWSNTHPGYWVNLSGPVALGVVTFLFTLVVGFHALWERLRHYYNFTEGWIRYVRLVAEAIVALMWIGTATLMLHSPQDDPLIEHTQHPIPQVEWDLGIAFTFFEVAAFIVTTVLLAFRSSSKLSTAVGYV